MFLARTVEHTTDVDGMLARMTPEQFKRWVAMYSIRPWGVEMQAEDETPKPSALSVMRQQAGI
jgi:hypothetical protein